MILKTHDEIIESPTANDIKTVVSSLGGTTNYFAILDKDEDGWTYLQTSNWKNLGYTLEYQEGSLQRHYQAAFPTSDQVAQAFVWYLRSDKRWQSAFVWTRIELDGATTDSQQEKHTRKPPTKEELTITKALQIFGLKQGATKEQLKRQYREMIAKCHPDRVNHLDSEFQELAEEKTKLLNEAYSLLGKTLLRQ